MRCVVMVGCLLALVATARADHKQDAAQLFEEGRALRDQGRYDDACERFAQSNELERAAGTEANLGDCQEHLGHIAEAHHWFDDAAVLWDAEGDARADYARKRAAK